MYPPAWALANSTRLDFDEFGVAFAIAWSRIESRFLKLECWQAYQEQEVNESQAAYSRGDVELARELLRREARADQRLYEDVRDRGIVYARVRLVQEPLTPYLAYELMSYRIRVDMGENIEVVRFEPGIRLPNARHFDFLLFDRHTALIHDYGTADVGLQSGGWLTHEPGVIAELGESLTRLRQQGVSIQQYLAKV